jgi:hypothetical protein
VCSRTRETRSSSSYGMEASHNRDPRASIKRSPARQPMKASDLLAAIEDACLRPLLVEVALRERKLLEEHERQHLRAFEDGLTNLTFNRSNRSYDHRSEDGYDDDGLAQRGGEGGEGPDEGDHNAVRGDNGSAIKTTTAPSNSVDPTATTTPSGPGDRCSGTSQGQRRADSSRARAASPKRATATTKQLEEARSSHTGRGDAHHKRRGTKKEAMLKDETWEQVRYSSLRSVPFRSVSRFAEDPSSQWFVADGSFWIASAVRLDSHLPCFLVPTGFV